MKQTVLHRPVQTLVPAHRNKPTYLRRKQTDLSSLFVTLGMQSSDPGYGFVVRSLNALGEVSHFNDGLLHLSTSSSIDHVFKQINEALVDPRVDSGTGLVVLDPETRRAKWYLSLEVSGLLNTYWHDNTNLFVCFKGQQSSIRRFLYDIMALGIIAPISKSAWYISSSYSPDEVFEILAARIGTGDRLTVFDDTGRIKTWQTQMDQPNKLVRPEKEGNPMRATIHKPSWQEAALSEFL